MGIGGVTSQLQASVIAKVRNLAPNAANRWTDAFIRSMVHVADLILCEQAEVYWLGKDIALTADATYFAVPSDAVWIGAVLYSEDGTTFNDGVLWPATINELDQFDPKWPDTGGTKPTHYFLLSTPGTEGAKIAVYPYMNSITAQAVRLIYMACRPSNNLTMVATTFPEKVEDVYYVPMTLALMYGCFDNGTAKHYLGRAQQGINLVRSMYGNKRDDVFHLERPASPMGGQLA